MPGGFIKTAAVTPFLFVGLAGYNERTIEALMKDAEAENVKILVFPELCLTGASCGDLFLQERLIADARRALQDIINASENLDVLTFVGLPWKVAGKLYNVTAAVKSGKLLGLVPKSWPEFSEKPEEYRWFENGPAVPEPIDCGLSNIAGPDDIYNISTISAGAIPDGKYIDEEIPFGANLIFECESEGGVRIAVEMGNECMTPDPPSERLAALGAVIIVNPSADYAVAGHMKDSRERIRAMSERLTCAYVRAGAGPDESSSDGVFDGCKAIAENGKIIEEDELFTRSMIITDIHYDSLLAARRKSHLFRYMNQNGRDDGYAVISYGYSCDNYGTLHRKPEANPFVPSGHEDEICEEILSIQASALSKRMRHTNSSRLVLGLSGGLDSALALIASVRATAEAGFIRSNVLCLSMPAFGTSERTHDNSAKLAKAMGVEFREIDLTKSLLRHFEDIGHPADVHDTAYENAQARERTQILMDIANMEGGIVVGTGDMSEAALGWCTYNGDHMSMYAVNSGIPKTVVRMIIKYCAEHTDNIELKEVLEDILDTPVSPELLPADKEGRISQVTEDIVGPYELHDFFLYHTLKNQLSPLKIFWMADLAFEGKYSRAEIKKWLSTFYRRFFASQFKRRCCVDGPKIFDIDLSPGSLHMPSDFMGEGWQDAIDRLV